MPEPELVEPSPTTQEEAPAPEPEPEPWTPERVLAWNAYYDVYVVLGVLLLVFIVSASQISNASLWAWLRAGREQTAQGAPLVRDAFTYTQLEKSWVNIPWTFEWAYSGLYQLIAPDTAERRAGQMTSADQTAAGTLVALTALARLLTALLLLSLRHKGPGLWWTALCTMLALGGILGPPSGFTLGGLAGQPVVAPDTWGMVFLALELLMLHRGRPGSFYGLIPLFLIWANVDESFSTGLIVLAAAVLGTLQKPEATDVRPIPFARGLAVLAACAAVCLVNPSFYRIYPAAFAPLLHVFAPQVGPIQLDQISTFGPTMRETLPELWSAFLAYYLVIVGLGLGSFFLNRARFSLSRFLVFLATAVLWGAVLRYRSEFALVLAATLALNGQEWYHDRFGVEGRMGPGWAFWSIGGRAVTIVLICLFIVKGLTGYGAVADEPMFGFGVNPDLFQFEAADALRAARIDGNVLNTGTHQGDALLWRAFPVRKAYSDDRPNLFTPQFKAGLEDLRAALRDDDVPKWKPALDEYHVTVVMIDPDQSARTYERLSNSPNWIRFYDDGSVVLFGRADAAEPDLSYFKENQLDADTLVYRQTRPVASTDRPPRMVTQFDRMFYDRVFQNRYRIPPQPHVKAAVRWLATDPTGTTIPDPAHCLLAVREARSALARRPDDTGAYRVLTEAYRLLLYHESALLTGQVLSAVNRDQITPQASLLPLRANQYATALNYAIRTTPPPPTAEARASLRSLNEELGRQYLNLGMVDLAYQRLSAAQDLSNAADIPPQFHTLMTELAKRIDDVQTRLAAMPEQEQADPVNKAQLEMSLGAVGMAIDELYEADQAAVRVGVVRPLLLDLYCQTGQPDKALDILGSNANDPALSTLPGSASRRQGLVSLLLGNYEYSTSLWEQQAIAQLRSFEAMQALASGRDFLHGDVEPATRAFEELPDRVVTQAGWEADLGLCLLEDGQPARAAEHMTNALKLKPDLPIRPVLVYYLEQLGQPAAPIPLRSPAASAAPAEGSKPSESAAPGSAAKPAEPAKKP